MVLLPDGTAIFVIRRRALPCALSTFVNLFFTDVFAKGPYHAQNEWDAHLDRLAQIESLYPEKYPSPATYRPKTPTLESHFPKRAWSPAPKAPSEKAVAFNYAGIHSNVPDFHLL